MLVGSIVVHDQMQIQGLRSLGIDGFQEPNELLMTMSRHAVSDDSAVEGDQSREQRRRTVPFVIMGQGATTALLHGQSWLGAVESLDLGLLVDTQHQRLFGGG